ncbi:hypothetical protein GGI43DRAFT_146160 [Trichoderma evansii]
MSTSIQILFNDSLRRVPRLLPFHSQHHPRNPSHESVGRLGHGGILLAVALNLWLTNATVLLGDGVQHAWDVTAAAPPSCFV